MDAIAVCSRQTTNASNWARALIPSGAYLIVDTGDPLPHVFDAL
jgi:hypothetical protein